MDSLTANAPLVKTAKSPGYVSVCPQRPCTAKQLQQVKRQRVVGS